MASIEDAPPSRWQWLDWWFAPRWRALLTWVALTGIAVAADLNTSGFYKLTQLPIGYLNRFLPVPLPTVVNDIAYSVTFWLLLIWFQPLALRLSLRRGLAWIGLPLGAEILRWLFLPHEDWTLEVVQSGSAALQCGVLWGWRTRPWLCLPAQAATVALTIIEPLHYFVLPYWLAVTVYALPTASLLLYGTRLLKPEERAQRPLGIAL